jgi:protein-S-isoprenylcysteine O-methyltransferase Ste14
MVPIPAFWQSPPAKSLLPPAAFWRVPVPEWSRIARRIRVPLGFAFSILYLWMARPTRISIAVGALIALPGIVLRALASGHVRKNQELTISGPYAYTRNPLYLGSLVMAVGFAVAARSPWILALLALFFVAIYLPVIRSEEESLRRMFPGFEQYTRQVPRLLPRLRGFGNQRGAFSRELYWKHREYNVVVGTAVVMAALVAKLCWWSN